MVKNEFLKEPKSYESYYEFPFPPDEKEPVVIEKSDTITEIYPPDKPFSANIVWVWASTDKISQTMFQLSPGAFFSPPDIHAGDEMYYVLSGKLTEIQPELGITIEAEEGEAIYIPKGSFHQSYNFEDEEATILCAIAPRMWDEDGPAPTMDGEPKLFKTGRTYTDTSVDTERLKVENKVKSIDNLGQWPVDGEMAREKKIHVKIGKEDRLPVIHGKKHPMVVRFIVSNDFMHMAELQLPAGGEGPRTSEPEIHDGDETIYVTKGNITLFFPELENSLEVPEGSVALIPEGTEHQYQNYTSKPVKGIFSVAPNL
ncbi:MAG: cupin domain-containing protein [Candidatus Hadarchaeia archaeon]